VLIQVKAASVNAYDWHLVRAKPFFTRFIAGMFKPKNNIIGADVAGVVVSVGDGVSRFKKGDEIFCCLEGCGKGGLGAGGFAEYVCAKETNLAPKSEMLSFEESAALPMASVTALQALRDAAELKQGQSVLINGASGGVGMFALQISKAFGAEVTAVCSTGSINIVREFGADYIVDYTKENVADSGKQFDIVVDVAATLSVKNYRSLLKPNGICVVIGFSTIGHMVSYNLAGKRDGKRIKLCTANNKVGDDLLEINKLIEAGQLKVVIDSRYPLSETAEAIRHAETGHPKGKIVIQVCG
jgi:NADPH:quinone reductase-like Zn-dependent oxidoreductase